MVVVPFAVDGPGPNQRRGVIAGDDARILAAQIKRIGHAAQHGPQRLLAHAVDAIQQAALGQLPLHAIQLAQ